MRSAVGISALQGGEDVKLIAGIGELMLAICMWILFLGGVAIYIAASLAAPDKE